MKSSEQTTRERIVDAAFRAFIEKGYAGTSTLEIATRAKVSKRDLYAHFDSKEALLATGIAERTREMVRPLALPEVGEKAGLEATLLRLGQTFLMGVTDPHVIAVHRLAIAEAHRSPELARTLNENGRDATVKLLAGFLHEARARAQVGPHDPVEMAGVFYSLVQGDLLVRILLGVADRPTARAAAARTRRAVEHFLRLYKD
jgi:AcrR family transcriptional regulator